MTQQKIISAYHGEFTQQVINMLLKHAKMDLGSREIDRRTLKRTYNILVEVLENIQKHAARMKEQNAQTGADSVDGIVVLGHAEQKYYVTVGNLVNTDEIEGLKMKIDQVNNLDHDGLKAKYKEIITNGSISERGGAGLGIIDIAMKSKNKLDYNFAPHDDRQSFFALQVVVDDFTETEK